MHYVSTRGGMEPLSFSEVVLNGLAPDGGLAVPDHYPHIDFDTLEQWRKLSYAELAFEIMRLFIDDIPEDDLKVLVEKAYRPEIFGGHEEITPLKTLEPNFHILALSNGPTLAFKDIAMQFLGHLFEYVLKRENRTLNILGATSGDTGSAAEYAMRGKEGVRVIMLSPNGRMSAFQRAQMYSLMDENIINLAVEGSFDDCQDVVKAVSNDLEFKAHYKIGAVNSINWARIVAQVVYYFKGYFQATSSSDQSVRFVVPSGNFGNVYAGHIARQMGLPIERLVVATNENDVLDEFFRTGKYRVRQSSETHVTSSPSMDISKASNFERFIYDVVGARADILKSLWQSVEKEGGFDFNAIPYANRIEDFGFVSGRSTHADRLACIKDVWERYQLLIDPHTADGVKVAQAFRESDVPVICLETALPAKFADTIKEAIGIEPPLSNDLALLETLPQRVKVISADIEQVKQIIKHQCN
ncbi:MAG: threonine synthase [Pseudomonadota bacterium]